mmetsp:Transcript_20448/g.17132  ORF Transcript_20448/g.17132 Transcript_20448/m.17132 type:complete len:81 (-) Transcript_20448:133-375(-)
MNTMTAEDFGLDDDYRMKVFGDNLRYIDESNSKGLSYTLGITSFTHLCTQSFWYCNQPVVVQRKIPVPPWHSYKLLQQHR